MSWIQHFLRRPPPPSLLQQWQAEARLARLQVLPLHLLLQTQLRSLEASEEAARAKTASSRDRPKLWRRIARMTGFARSAPAPAPARRIQQSMKNCPQNAPRARARTENPPTLPPASGGAAPPPLPAVGADPGLEGGAPGIVVPWDQSTLKPLFDQLIPTLENLTVAQITSRAAKARLPKDVLAEVEKDARWAEPARKAVAISAPQVAAKWLNKSGISAENQAELVLGTAVASILTGHVMLMRKLDKLIASQSTAPPPPPQEKN